jgi:hypothetical protein
VGRNKLLLDNSHAKKARISPVRAYAYLAGMQKLGWRFDAIPKLPD